MISKIEIWYKWLKYNPKFYKNEKRELYEQDILKMNSSEFEKLKIFKQEDQMLSIIKKYINNEASMYEVIKVTDYVNTHNINNLILRKLNNEKISLVESKVFSIINSDEKISKNISQLEKSYNCLKMEDLYLLIKLYEMQNQNEQDVLVLKKENK